MRVHAEPLFLVGSGTVTYVPRKTDDMQFIPIILKFGTYLNTIF
jgi:hypothetical protein